MQLWAHIWGIYLYSQLMLVSQMMGGCGPGGRAARVQKVSGLFSDPCASVLEQDTELQIASSVTSLVCD